jgi:O-antigen ligase
MKRRRGSHASSEAPARTRGDQRESSRLLWAGLFTDFGRPALLALATALLVSTPLVSSELGVISDGSGASWHLMWLLLACLSLLGSTLLTTVERRWTWADLCVGILVGWHLVSALLTDGNQRHAWNGAWQWAAYGALAIVLRQQIVTSLQARQLVVIMLALAVGVSLHAYYQYFVKQPALREAFQQNPDAILQQMNIAPGTTGPIRAIAENRINSVEPIAEFSLTNSLAGFLLPWILISLAVAFWSVQRGESLRTAGTLVILALVMSGVLILTKSRTAWLAAFGGCALILMFGRRTGWQINWRWPAGIAATVLVLGLLAVAAKGLDAEVLSEAPKSVLYRVEYWRATAAMIAESPLLGTGPGNFQERYARHKLPEASETIADPHNFLLEVWSTAGTPALLALLALMFATAWQLARQEHAKLPTSNSLPNAEEAPAEDVPIAQFAMLIGAFLGLLLAGLLGFIVFDPLETTSTNYDPNDQSLGVPIIWITGAFSLVVCYFFLGDWLKTGELPRSAVVIALVALLVNLLAGGAAIFPGVANTAWLLWVLAMREEQDVTPAAPDRQQRWITYVLAAVTAIGAVGCYQTEYLPIFSSEALLRDAFEDRSRGRTAAALELTQAAIQADPWSPRPRQMQADTRLALWLIEPVERNWPAFENAMLDYEQSSPYHYVQHQKRGEWLLQAARRIKSNDLLTESAKAFEAAIDRYPNSAYLHAQLALVYRELNDSQNAVAQAQEALRLDALCPHREQKLKERKLFDPQWSLVAVTPDSSDPQRPSAEQVVEEILKQASSPQDNS